MLTSCGGPRPTVQYYEQLYGTAFRLRNAAQQVGYDAKRLDPALKQEVRTFLSTHKQEYSELGSFKMLLHIWTLLEGKTPPTGLGYVPDSQNNLDGWLTALLTNPKYRDEWKRKGVTLDMAAIEQQAVQGSQ